MKSEKKQSRLKEFIDNPRKALWKLAVPMMFGMMIQTVYMIADMIFVGQVSADSLTALAFNMPLLFFGLGITFGVGVGQTKGHISIGFTVYVGNTPSISIDSYLKTVTQI